MCLGVAFQQFGFTPAAAVLLQQAAVEGLQVVWCMPVAASSLSGLGGGWVRLRLAGKRMRRCCCCVLFSLSS